MQLVLKNGGPRTHLKPIYNILLSSSIGLSDYLSETHGLSLGYVEPSAFPQAGLVQTIVI
jgi:hypothetical protein